MTTAGSDNAARSERETTGEEGASGAPRLAGRDRVTRACAMLFWRGFNPIARAVVAIAPWWVVLETVGQRSGLPRRVPLARGPQEQSTLWLIAVHGNHAHFVHNIAADPSVRVRLRGRWRSGTAAVLPYNPEIVRQFNRYARIAPRTMGIEPKLIKVDLETP